MPFGIGPLELVLIVVVFGARRLPDIGRSLGSSARQFTQGLSGEDEPQATQALAGPPKDAGHPG